MEAYNVVYNPTKFKNPSTFLNILQSFAKNNPIKKLRKFVFLKACFLSL